MPTLSTMNVPPPTSWDEFEEITRSALILRWSSPDLERNGRSGQAQHGVDVYGDDHLGRLTGVQCKLVSSGELSMDVVEAEVRKAEGFEPHLQSYFIATTARRDARLQREVRLLSKDRVAQGAFGVGILFWEDIVQDLTGDPDEFAKHYPQLTLGLGGAFRNDAGVNIPSKTLVMLPVDRGCWWHMGVRGKEPAMQIVAEFRVTNVSDWFIHPHSALLTKLCAAASHIFMRWPDDNRASFFPIPPRETVVVMCDFWVVPPVLAKNEPLESSVVLTDQLGNRHEVAVRMPYR